MSQRGNDRVVKCKQGVNTKICCRNYAKPQTQETYIKKKHRKKQKQLQVFKKSCKPVFQTTRGRLVVVTTVVISQNTLHLISNSVTAQSI